MDILLLALFRIEYILQLIAAEALVAQSFQRRKGFVWKSIFSILLCVGLYALLQGVENPFASLQTLGPVLAGWRYLIIFAATVLCLLACFEESVWSILFCCSAAQATQHLAHRVRDLIFAFVGRTDRLSVFFAVTALVIVPVYAVIYLLFFRKLRDKEFPNINNRNMTLTVTACILLCLFIGVHGTFDSVLNYVIFDLTMILVCFFILAYQFDFLDNSYQRMEYESLQRAFREAQKHYEMTQENIEIINIKCHDIRQQIRLLGREARLDEQALKEITDAVSIYDSAIDTGNKVLDVILTDKSISCEKKQIRFGCMMDGDALEFMSSMDLASLFGNLIDNAIEAVVQLDDPEKAIINLNVRTMNGAVFIHCENYYHADLSLTQGIPSTTKADTHFHGFGIKSIRFVVEKYGGAMTIVPEDDVFNVNITIPLPV